MTFKEKVHSRFVEVVNEKINVLQKTLEDLKETASNETKSTAGDKHETALAMIQLEQENKNKQLQDVLLQKQLLNKINPLIKTVAIVNGSLAKTNVGYLFFSAALGKIVIEGKTVIALSIQSPLGTRLAGLKVNDTAELNGAKYVVEEID